MPVHTVSGWRALAAALVIGTGPVGAGAMLSLVASPAAAQAADVVLDDLRLDLGQITYRAARAEFRGTPLSKAELTSLLDPASPEALAVRVARLQAAEIAIPEITSEVATPHGPQVTRYRDVLFTNVAAGRIASVAAAGGTIEARGPDGLSTGTFGRFALQNLDLGLAVSLMTEKATSATPAMKPLYGSFSIEMLRLVDAGGTTTTVGRIFGRDLSARPTAEGWLGSLNILGANPDLKKASPEDRKRGFEAMADLFGAFELGAMEAVEVAFGGKDPNSGSGRIARIGFKGGTASQPADIAIDGFEAGSNDGSVRFASLSFGGFSLQPMLDGLRGLGATTPDEMSPAQMRKLFPIVGRTRLSQLEVDLPSGDMPRLSGPSPRMKIALADAEMVADKAVEGIPSDLRFSLRNLTFPIAANPDNDGLKQLAGLGYDRFDASATANIGWNEAGQELMLREISVDGASMGSAVIRGIVGNATRDLFNPDSAIASVALLGATGKSAEVTLENRGLFERIIAREARRQKRAAEDIRREYGMAAAVGIPAILGNSAGAKTLAQAVARFVAKPGKLTIRARAKQAAGFGVADFSARPDPGSVLEALEISAVAE